MNVPGCGAWAGPIKWGRRAAGHGFRGSVDERPLSPGVPEKWRYIAALGGIYITHPPFPVLAPPRKGVLPGPFWRASETSKTNAANI